MLDQNVKSARVDEADSAHVNHDVRRVRGAGAFQGLVEQRGSDDVEFPFYGQQ
jgi:hypothetical protein